LKHNERPGLDTILLKISDFIFNTTVKNCLLGMSFFFAGVGIGYKIPAGILILYFILFFGKEQTDRIIQNKQSWKVLLYILGSLLIFTGILYSDNIKIRAWESKYTIALSYICILFVIFTGEGKKSIWLFLASFLAGTFAYILSIFSFELFFYPLKYSWQVILNPFAWEARSSKYLLGKIESGLTVASVVWLLYLLKSSLHKEKIPYLRNETLKILMLATIYLLLGLGVPHAISYPLPVAIFLAYLLLYFKPETLLVLFKKRLILYFYILSVAYFILVYTLGEDIFSNPYITRRIYISVFYLSIFLLCAINEKWNTHKMLIISFVFGLFSYSSIVVGYSAWLDPVEYGYKNLYNPFSQSIDNSPFYSNILVLGFSTALITFLLIKSKTIKILSSLTILLSVMSVLFIMGRTFLLISIFSTTLVSLLHKRNKLFPFLIATILGSVFFTTLIYHSVLPDEAVARFDKMFINRIDKLIDGNNPRYVLWLEGFTNIFDNPSGDFIPQEFTPKSKSFHNLWIDTVKYGGWLSLGILLFINIITIITIKMSGTKENVMSYVFISVVTILLMSQEVVLESKLLYVLYLHLMISFLFLGRLSVVKNQ
jgi:hypothetical protein